MNTMNGEMQGVSLPTKIVLNLLKIIGCCCKFSNKMRQNCINYGIFNIINTLIPSEKENHAKESTFIPIII